MLSASTNNRLDWALGWPEAANEIERRMAGIRRTGNVFYVDPEDGEDADTRDGLSPSTAWKTINYALDSCVADNGDWIICLEGSHSVTATQTLDVAGVTIAAADMGLNAIAGGEKFTINAASSYTDGPAVTITQPCRIIGMGIAGRQTAGESLLFDANETGGYNAGFCELINCRFSAWYGAMDALIRMKAGQSNRLINCTFDGLFGGVGTAGVILETDGAIDPGYLEVLGCRFAAMGSGKHAISHNTGDTPVSVLYAHNYLLPGFAGDAGKFLDNNNCDATGLIADNWVAPLANQAAAFENLTNATFGFADNHYEEA